MLRIILWGLAAIVTGLILLVVAAVLLFNPNHYRGRISAEVDQTYHRKLDIGDIRLSIFPTLGVRIKDLKLDNAPGFGPEPMAQVGEAEVGIRILPLLLHDSVEISSITLKDMQLQLLRHADGRSNWDDLNEHEKEAKAKPGEVQPHPEPHPGPGGQEQGGFNGTLQIGGIDIDNANIS
jgi:AsmA protein